MTEFRTRVQIEADKLDMELHRVMQKTERFAAEWLSGSIGADVHEKAARINAIRNVVRHHMHPVDRKATKDS